MPIAVDFLCNQPNAWHIETKQGNKMQKPPKSSHSTTVDIANSKEAWASTSDAFLSWLYPWLGCILPQSDKFNSQGCWWKRRSRRPCQIGPKTCSILLVGPKRHRTPHSPPSRDAPGISGTICCPDSGFSADLESKGEEEGWLFTPLGLFTHRVALWKLDKDRFILTPHSTHSSHMTLPTAPVFAIFTGRSLGAGAAVPSLTAAQKAGCLPSDSDMERARLLKPSDRLQMPDFSLSSE